jgi:Cu(I)/Ag(I) efflux system membrane fusion protein
VDNSDGLLKPEMFVRATVLAKVDGGGGVVAEDLAGKWICPMHPEVVKDRRGACDICGMDLVTADELGYVKPSAEGRGPLVVPRTAVLLTGRRAIVYVEVPDAERPTYEGREVVLGPRAGDVYLVVSGLAEGERVVVNGNFMIDSALQFQAKPSMMGPPDGGATLASLAPLAPLYDAYFRLGAALAADDPDAARAAAREVRAAAKAVKIEGAHAAHWESLAVRLRDSLAGAEKSEDLAKLRPAFEKASGVILEIENAFGHAGAAFYRVHCPMAFGRGADWVQDHDTVDNPYYGAQMLRCGSVTETLSAAPGGE